MKLDLSLVENKCRYILSIPGNNITGFVIDKNPQRDSAYCILNSKVIGISEKFLNHIFKTVNEEDIPLCLESILTHEALHSIATNVFPSDVSQLQSFFVNHLEDYRLNQTAISWQPSLEHGFQVTYKSLDEIRPKTQEVDRTSLTGTERVRADLFDFIEVMDLNSFSPNFEYNLDFLEFSNNYSKETNKLLSKISPKIKQIVNLPPDPFDKSLTYNNSLKSMNHILSILKDLEPYFQFDKNKNKDLLKDIKDAIKNKSQEQSKDNSQETPQDSKDNSNAPKTQQEQPSPSQDNNNQKESPEQASEGQPQQDGNQDIETQDGNSTNSKTDTQGQEKSDPKSQGNSKSDTQKQEKPDSQGQGNSKSNSKEQKSSKVDKKSQEDVKTPSNLQNANQSNEKENNSINNPSKQNNPNEETTQKNSKLDELSIEELKRLEEVVDKFATDVKAESHHIKLLEGDVIEKQAEVLESKGYTHAEAKEEDLQHNIVGSQEYSNFIHKYYNIVSKVSRSFSNKDDKNFHDGAKFQKSAISGSNLHIKNISKYLNQPTIGEPPPFYKNYHSSTAKGNKVWKLDKLFFSIDGSGSMHSVIPFVQILMGIMYEASRRARIPAAISVAYDGKPTILSTGTFLDQPETVIKKCLAIRAQGGTNISEGSLKSLLKFNKGVRENGGRLVMITDCETSSHDLSLMSAYSTKFQFPSMILGVGTKSNIQHASNMFKAGSVIGVQTNHNRLKLTEKNSLEFFNAFSLWMKDPDLFSKKYNNFLLLDDKFKPSNYISI